MTRSAWLLFGALSIIWGVPYFFIKIALHDPSLAWIAFSRVALGALILAPFVPVSHWYVLRTRGFAIAAVALTDIALPFVPAALLHPPSKLPSGSTLGAIGVLGAVCTSAAYVTDFARSRASVQRGHRW